MLNYPVYVEKTYCFECWNVHFIEILPNKKEICHGEILLETSAHYARRSGRGFELRAKGYKPLPLAWQFAAEARREDAEF